jgi:phosphomannomutase
VDEKETITSALKQALGEVDFKIEKVWGDAIEDRGGQITFSALGQQAPIEAKKKWDPDFTRRKKLKAHLDKLIPEFSVRLGARPRLTSPIRASTKATGFENSATSLALQFQR